MASDPPEEKRPHKPSEGPADEPRPSGPAEDSTAKPVLSAGLPINGIPRVVSLIVLLAVVLLIGVLFFRVMSSFIVPLFLAAVIAVVFKPLHQWSLRTTGGRPHRSALITTTIVSLAVLVPTVGLGWRAYVETSRIVRVLLKDDTELLATLGDDGVGEANQLAIVGSDAASLEPESQAAKTPPTVGTPVEETTEESPDENAAADEAADDSWLGRVRSFGRMPLEWYQNNVDDSFDPNATLNAVARYSAQQAVGFGLVGIQALVGFAIGMGIMIFALYYFLADGPSIIETVMRLSPLDDEYEHELLVQFASVSRAVVVATLLSAVVQGLLAGIGYYFALEPGSPVFLLTVLTMLLAIVPFVGATAVWIPVALWVFFVQDDAWPGIFLALYGGGIVSTIDNVLKPLVLHGQSNLHPLLALLSILGGIQLLGPVGILVGPMLVAFMQALLGMLRRELDSFSEPADNPAASDTAEEAS